jgi:transcriptional regulator with XRE-family HTH domain
MAEQRPAAPDPELVTLGALMRGVRKRRRLSQRAVSVEAGVSATLPGIVERGERNLTYANLARMCAALGLCPSELVVRAERLTRCRA